MASQLQISEQRGYTFALCSIASPIMLQSDALAFYGGCASGVAQGQNIMAVRMPLCPSTKGQLYLASRSAEDIVAKPRQCYG